MSSKSIVNYQDSSPDEQSSDQKRARSGQSKSGSHKRKKSRRRSKSSSSSSSADSSHRRGSSREKRQHDRVPKKNTGNSERRPQSLDTKYYDKGKRRDVQHTERRQKERKGYRKEESRTHCERESVKGSGYRDRSDRNERRRRSRSPRADKRHRSRDRHREKEREKSRSPVQKRNSASTNDGTAAASQITTPKVAILPSNPLPPTAVSLPTLPIATTLTQPYKATPPVVVAQAQAASSSASVASTLPSYYNPNAINVAKYTDQIQKRKLLWSHKKTENVDKAAAKWQQTAQFSKDEDGKVASKFMRLMGIREPTNAAEVGPPKGASGTDFAKKQADMFSTMEQQYEVARQATHTMRGMGLGFSSQSRPY